MINSISWICFGDSIALGIAQAAGLPCDAVVGRQPHEVLAAIQCTNPEFIRGRTVILSSGLSNNPDGRSYVEEQIMALQGAEARLIVVLGVGPGVRAGTNEWLAGLARLCDRFGPDIVFAGPIQNTRSDADPKGIHPWSYSQVVDQINRVLAAIAHVLQPA